MFISHKTMTPNAECGTEEGATNSTSNPTATTTTDTTSSTTIAPTRPTSIPINMAATVLPTDSPSPNGNHKSTIVIDSQPKRRISIVSEESVLGYENPAYDLSHVRKISQSSTHSPLEIGPTGRRRSILKDALAHDNESDRVSTHSHENNRRSTLDVLNSRLNGLQGRHGSRESSVNNVEKSWIYSFCLKCRGEEHSEAWEPPFWQKIFPYPLCPTFRTCSRLVSLMAIGILIWFVAFVIIGQSAAPGGEIFGMGMLAVAANFGGYIVSLTTLPRLIGQLMVGLLFQNVGWVNVDGDFTQVTVHLRKLALTVILTRAGLEMDPNAFKKVYKTILKLGIVPWLVEFGVMAIMSHYLLNLPWIWGCMLGAIMAAIAPAVVVPCLFRLRTKGYGVTKGIPTLVVAVAGVDDAISVAVFGIICTILFSDRGQHYVYAQVPVCILGGLGYGVIWGSFSRIVPEKGDAYVVPLRTLMLFSANLVAIYGSELVGFEGAGPLAVVFSSFISNYFWCKDGWTIDKNPVATGFEIFWMIFEPILFGLTGATVKLHKLEPTNVYIGAICIYTCVVVRVLVTAGIAFGDRLNLKEKFFVGLSWMAKATVQAALGPVALRHLGPNSSEEEKKWAKTVQTVSILSIALTAPLGAILISVTGTRMLKKIKNPENVTGWRSSHRPSIRDISIIEEKERVDPERNNTQNNLQIRTSSK